MSLNGTVLMLDCDLVHLKVYFQQIMTKPLFQIEHWRGGRSVVSCKGRFPQWVRIPSGQTLVILGS